MKKWSDLGLKQVSIVYEEKNKTISAKGTITGTTEDLVSIVPNSPSIFLCLTLEDGNFLLIPEGSILSIKGQPTENKGSNAEQSPDNPPAPKATPQQANKKEKNNPPKKNKPTETQTAAHSNVKIINRYERTSRNSQNRRAE